MAKYRHGIFCLENDWWDVKDRTSVQPILELLNRYQRAPYIHRGVGTREEFDYYINKWTQKGLSRYPILYLAFHGVEGALSFGNKGGAARRLTLGELGDTLEGRCKKQIIHFGGCSTLALHGAVLNTFLRKTHALAIMGYNEDVSWIDSAAFEMFLLGCLQDVSFTKQGMSKLQRQVQERAGTLARGLGFRLKLAP